MKTAAATLMLILCAACAGKATPVFTLDPEFVLTGYWSKESGTEGTSLLLSRLGEQGYPVRLSSAGCVGAEVKQIHADFESGYLVLSEAVTEYSGTTYSRLRLYVLGRRYFLVPELLEAAFRSGDLDLALEFKSGVP